MEKLYTSKTYLKMADGWMHALILPPRFAPGHKLQKPSKKSGIFQSLSTISFALFLLEGRVTGGGTRRNASPLNTLLSRSPGLGACEEIISSFKSG